jgi:hypothetical protein
MLVHALLHCTSKMADASRAALQMPLDPKLRLLTLAARHSQ